eukprot:g17207.t1
MLSARAVRGGVCVVGPQIDEIAEQYLNSAALKQLPDHEQLRQNRENRDAAVSHHVTLIASHEIPQGRSAHELAALFEQEGAGVEGLGSGGTSKPPVPTTTTNAKAKPKSSKQGLELVRTVSVDTHPYMQLSFQVFPLGVGTAASNKNRCYFVVVCFPRGQAFREFLGLGAGAGSGLQGSSSDLKDFHITLGFGSAGDVHGVSKGVTSLLGGGAAIAADWPDSSALRESVRAMLATADRKGVPGAIAADVLASVRCLLDHGFARHAQAGPAEDVEDRDEEEKPDDVVEDLELLFCRTAAKVAGRAQRYEEVVRHAEAVLDLRKNDLPALQQKAFALLRGRGGAACAEFLVKDVGDHGGRSDATLQKVLKIALASTSSDRTFPSPSAASRQKHETSAGEPEGGMLDHDVEQTVECNGTADGTRPAAFLAKKYPRTQHLKNLGAATDDDVIAADCAERLFIRNGEVFVEEKIDGANVGFSLQDWQIRVQNRGHAVCSATSAQFSQIDDWVDEHRAALFQLLSAPTPSTSSSASPAATGTSECVLYGEWCALKHSVFYNRLPGLFVAFDLWDGRRFLPRAEFHALLQGTGIPVVPVLFKGELPSFSFLRDAILDKTRSRFSAATCATEEAVPIEGVMLRKDGAAGISGRTAGAQEASGGLLHRMKLVRAEFQQGITTFWAKQKQVKNVVDFEFQLEYLNSCYSEAANVLPLNPRERVVSPGRLRVRMMRNLSALLPDVLVGSTPLHEGHVRALEADYDVGLVITLTEETPLPAAWFRRAKTILADGGEAAGSGYVGDAAHFYSGAQKAAAFGPPGRDSSAALAKQEAKKQGQASRKRAVAARADDTVAGANEGEAIVDHAYDQVQGSMEQFEIDNLFVPTPNYFPPSPEQIDGALEELRNTVTRRENKKRVFIHCGGGKGRAGTLAACCLLKFGLDGQQLSRWDAETEGYFEFPESAEVVRFLRERRPGSIETDHQEKFVRSYAHRLWQLCEQAAEDGPGLPRTTSLQRERDENELADLEAESSSSQGARGVGDKYPSTPYLPFSPSVADDGQVLRPQQGGNRSRGSDGAVLEHEAYLFGKDAEIVITEKLDGGNCCIKDGGLVFARTHAHVANHESFEPVRQMLRSTLIPVTSKASGRVGPPPQAEKSTKVAQNAGTATAGAAQLMKPLGSILREQCPAGLELYGENMTAVHSIDYGEIGFPFYLFAVRLHGVWLAWDKVEQTAKRLKLPLVPVKYRGPALSSADLEKKMRGWAAERSALVVSESRSNFCGAEREVLPEGFVVRNAAATTQLERSVAKYVRANHIQTSADFKRTWKKHDILHTDVTDFETKSGAHAEEGRSHLMPGTARSDAAPAAASEAAKVVEEVLPAVQRRVNGDDEYGGLLASETATRPGEKPEVPAADKIRPRAAAQAGFTLRSGIRLVILVGLPGSGKSSFVRRLRALLGDKQVGGSQIAHLCQDALGREALENGVGAAYKSSPLLVVDRCNLLERDRQRILDLCFNPAKEKVLVVYFPTPAEVCSDRVARRLDHPTIPFGRGKTVVDSFVKRGIEVPGPLGAAYQAVRVGGGETSEPESDGGPSCRSPVDEVLRRYLLTSSSNTSDGEAALSERGGPRLRAATNAVRMSSVVAAKVKTALSTYKNAWPAIEVYCVSGGDANAEGENRDSATTSRADIRYIYVHRHDAATFPRTGFLDLDQEGGDEAGDTNAGAGGRVEVTFYREYDWLDEIADRELVEERGTWVMDENWD